MFFFVVVFLRNKHFYIVSFWMSHSLKIQKPKKGGKILLLRASVAEDQSMRRVPPRGLNAPASARQVSQYR